MNRLMLQTQQPDQIRGRESRVRTRPAEQKIAYQAPNGIVFYIDTRPTNTGGEPIVSTKEREAQVASHDTHTLGKGHVCLANSIRGWDLTKILFYCDSWARGVELYRLTGLFPRSPLNAFTGH